MLSNINWCDGRIQGVNFALPPPHFAYAAVKTLFRKQDFDFLGEEIARRDFDELVAELEARKAK